MLSEEDVTFSGLFGFREPALALFTVLQEEADSGGLDCRQTVDGLSNMLQTFLAKCSI